MLDLFKVAFRNVGRNKRRSLITIITIFLGVVFTTATRGLLNGLQDEIRSAMTRKVNGDLQIHHLGYQDSLESSPFKLLIPFSPEKAAELSRASPEISDIAPRLRLMAIINHQGSQITTAVAVTGIDSPRELAVCPRLAQSVVQGEMLDSTKEKEAALVEDQNLEEAGGLDQKTASTTSAANTPRAEGFHQIMVTPNLMRGLKAKIGDEIVILLADRDNMQQALVARLTGVVDFGLPTMSARMAFMDYNTLSKVLSVRGKASELVLRSAPKADLDKIKSMLTRAVASDEIVETWLEVGGTFVDAMHLQNIIFSVILAIVFAIVISAIINTSLMTVMERTREIGTLMALGYRRRHILTLFLCEFAVIGMMGAIAGVFVAEALVGILAYHGLIVTLPGQVIKTILYPNVSLAFLSAVFILAVLSALLAGIIPAYRASRLRPVQALYSV